MTFEEWKAKQEQMHNDYDAENAWNAGVASRQAEIDALQNKYDIMLKAFNLIEKHRYELGRRIDELQKRLSYSENAYKDVKLNFLNEEDDLSALKKRIYNTLSAACDNKCNHAVIDILKGDKND